MKNHKFKIIIASVIIVLVAIAILTFMFWPASISSQDAIDIATSHVGGGRANPAEREFESFQRVWSVEVFYDGLVHEVFINVNTGEVIRVELDSWD